MVDVADINLSPERGSKRKLQLTHGEKGQMCHHNLHNNNLQAILEENEDEGARTGEVLFGCSPSQDN